MQFRFLSGASLTLSAIFSIYGFTFAQEPSLVAVRSALQQQRHEQAPASAASGRFLH